MIGKKSELKTNEQPKKVEFDTVAIIKSMNVYDSEKGEYTDEINQKSVKVETFVKDIKTEKPILIGYILVYSLEKFLAGEIKAVPIKLLKK